MPWSETYRPKTFDDVIGQELAVARLKEFIKNYKYERKKAILLHGAPGVGKTTLALVAAKETNSELFELNASDVRNKAGIIERLKPALEQQSLISTNKIILIDEIDGLSGTKDRGGIPELMRLIETTNYPVIITANDAWKKALSPVRKKSEVIELKPFGHLTIKQRLVKILEKENKFLDGNILTKIAIKANGDIRAAINDLESVAKMEHPEEMLLEDRNKRTSIVDAIKVILKGKPMNETLRIFDSVKEPLDEIILWMEKNVPLEYRYKELERAFDKISKADVFKGRIYKKQYWRFLVYENILLSYGIAASKSSPKPGAVTYKKPTRILKIWMSNIKLAKKKSIAQKYAPYVHIGSKRAMNEFGEIKMFLKDNTHIQKELKLTDEEIAYLHK